MVRAAIIEYALELYQSTFCLVLDMVGIRPPPSPQWVWVDIVSMYIPGPGRGALFSFSQAILDLVLEVWLSGVLANVRGVKNNHL